MIFGPRHLTKKTTIDPFYMKQHRLEMVDHYKYLGITLDKHLTFNLHLSNVIQQVTEKGYLLRKIRPYLDKESSLLIYKNMILPYAEYGDFFYSHAASDKRKKIQTLQNTNIRLCLDLHPRANVQWIHQQAKLNLLEDRRNAHLLNFMCKRSKNPKYLDLRDLPLRRFDGPMLLVPDYTKSSSQLHINYKGATSWNNLPVEMRLIQTYTQFKNMQKKLMQNLL